MTSDLGNPGKELDPYVHQVSGRAHMLSLNKATLCKSLSIREWNFYVALPLALKSFAPKLKGLLYVLLEKGNDNSHRFRTSEMWIPPPLPGYEPALPHNADGSPNDHPMLKQTTFKGLDRLEYKATNGFTSHPWTVDKDQEALTEAVGKNPWSLRQHRREINRTLKGDILRKEVDLQRLWDATAGSLYGQKERNEFVTMFEKIRKKGNFIKAYLLLEDVTSHYRLPCVLDLKIGTQMGRDGCSQAKKDKHFNLVQRSSTGSLGIRLAGMQVYQVTTGEFLCRDKYYGRGLSTDGFKAALRQFFTNGQRLLTDIIPPILDRLVELRGVVEAQESFRFYASSVLLSYDGATESEELPVGTGRRNSASQNNSLDKNVEARSQTGVHMIDFAHSTFRGFLDDKQVYQGPDGDCLLALNSLIALLQEIQTDG